MRDATQARAQPAVAGVPKPRGKAKANVGQVGWKTNHKASRQRAREAAVVAGATVRPRRGELATFTPAMAGAIRGGRTILGKPAIAGFGKKRNRLPN